MFLINKLFNKVCNGSIGIIIENHIEVAFLVISGINQIVIEKITAYFNLNGTFA